MGAQRWLQGSKEFGLGLSGLADRLADRGEGSANRSEGLAKRSDRKSATYGSEVVCSRESPLWHSAMDPVDKIESSIAQL